MTNTERIQAHNAELQECIEMAENLPDAGGGGEDVTAETNEYTEKLGVLEAAIAELEEELKGKASGEGGLPTQEKTVDITTNGTHIVTPDDGYALSKITASVNVPIPDGYIKPNGVLEISQNGEHDVREYERVSVNVEDSSSSDAEIPWITREITEYSNPTLTKLGAYSISGTSITSLNLPALTAIAGYAFYECTTLTYMDFPLLTEVPYNGCRQFKGLVKADFNVLTKIGANGFYQCTNMEALIIRTNSLCTLAAGTVLTATKIVSGTGYIYVPAALLDSYKAATNWSTFAAQIRAIEDYPEITGG